MTGARVRLFVDDNLVSVPEGASVAAAVLSLGIAFRRSVSGERRSALCGMGVCFECRVNVDGVAQQRACMLPAENDMRVRTHD